MAARAGMLAENGTDRWSAWLQHGQGAAAKAADLYAAAQAAHRLGQRGLALTLAQPAFSDREAELARRSLHLAPSVLATELDQIDRAQHYPIYITHTKPAETGLIMEEIQRFDDTPNREVDVRHDIRWLNAGMCFEL
jgi:hypothetical protein